MFCRECGNKLSDNAKFCPNCGKAVTGACADVPPVKQTTSRATGKKRGYRLSTGEILCICASALAIVLVCFWALGGFQLFEKSSTEPKQQTSLSEKADGQDDQSEEQGESKTAKTPSVLTLPRPQLLSFTRNTGSVTAACASYQTAPDFSNVINRDQITYLGEDTKKLLLENQFAVLGSSGGEFFEIYETNRYLQYPNFVTVDSMMHTYHLYFSLLLNRTEKNYLSACLQELSEAMLAQSVQQYDALRGSEWEQAAGRNVAYFAVGASLQTASVQAPAELQELIEQQLQLIYDAEGIVVSSLTNLPMDYSQFKPRGYYEGDEVLERYFRAMMWYGQVNFQQTEEELNRSALLMTLAMEDQLPLWQQIYAVTAFFAGSSDDLGYCEYAPAITSAYGSTPTSEELKGNDNAFSAFEREIEKLEPPAINSVPVPETLEDVQETVKGFRFMGQRFTIDAAVMQQLVYKNVKENASQQKRLLPDTLDMPAALGSDAALKLLEQQGETAYEGYTEQMAKVRQWLADSPDELWSASLYSGWLYTLNPILEPKGEGYPAFMTNEQWTKKNLETYAGSFTELKHDTVLYAKQMMAEMGGGPIDPVDDRGYVEPEVEVYRRFAELAQKTADGLNTMGMLGAEDLENLSRLAELAERLMTISEKELRDELLSDEEYELIRCYGGTLEHFWKEAVKDKAQADYFDSSEIPASLVTDIATDPNGRVLQIANGRPSTIYVIVNVGGSLRVASGSVYDFYQFEVPIQERMTDTQWRQLIGEWAMPDGSHNWGYQPEKPWWTLSYRTYRQ